MGGSTNSVEINPFKGCDIALASEKLEELLTIFRDAAAPKMASTDGEPPGHEAPAMRWVTPESVRSDTKVIDSGSLG